MQTRALTTTGLIIALMLGLSYEKPASGQAPGMFGGNPMVSQTSYMVAQPPGQGVAPAYYQGGAPMPGMVAPVGYCSPSCDSYGGCDGCGAGGPGGLIGQICGNKSGLNGYENLCPFCRGGGCSLCQSMGNTGALGGALAAIAPYTEAGLCAQRWFDLQAEVMFLSMEGSSASQTLSSRGQGVVSGVTGQVIANRILSTDDVEFGGVSPGWRLTGSMLFGPGGNIEATYFGSNHFSESSIVAASLNGAGASNFDLFSAYSAFGTNPGGAPGVAGFDDTDRSSRHTLIATSDIHSGEANYRRRWVGPYCRFQGSWLVGFRYFDVDESLIFDARGAINDTAAATDPRFFTSSTQTRNSLVGAQLGGDLWWNVHPGINLGLGWKGAVFGNTAEQDTLIRSNSVNLAGVSQVLEQAQGSNTSLMTEIQARMVYRFSYAWSFTASYWFIGVDGLALGAGNLNTSQADQLFANPVQSRNLFINIDDSITMHGFSTGLEYLW